MKRITLAAAVCLGLLVLARPGRADTIYLKDSKKTVSGTITAETARGVKLRGSKEVIPAESIRDIDYDVKPADVRLKYYLKATNAEADARAATQDAVRYKKLAEALTRYQTALPKIDAKQVYARRQLAFKLAYLPAEQAQLLGKDDDRLVAIEKLQAFRKKYPDSWQLARALTMLARLQVEAKAYADAGETYKALAEAPVSEAVRQDAELKEAELSMKAGNFAAARQKLEALAGKLPKDSAAAQKARLGAAECLAALKDLPGARAAVQKVLADASDPDVKAAAYNALGYCDILADNYKDARWAFLWVDVEYNQNPAEHAKALYYLHQVFTRLNDPDRAQECLETLLNERQFAGLDYQRKAQQEQKRPGGG